MTSSARTPRSEPDPPNADAVLRVGHAERESVVELLTRAYADGRLDQTEFEDRTDRALRARTVGDVAPLTCDLTTGAEPTQGPESDAARGRPAAARTGAALRRICCCAAPRDVTELPYRGADQGP